MMEIKSGEVSIGNECKVCDMNFVSEEDFKEHILTTVHRGPADGTRNFKYRLTAKTAKNNLLKGAKRKHMEIEHKQGAINVDFSDGAWVLAVFPEILSWDKSNRNFTYCDLDIQVIEAKPGIDGGNNNVDYKIVFQVNGQKVVLHAYNGKQRLTLNGQGHRMFVQMFLDPFFRSKISKVVSEANSFNENVLFNLGKTVKRENIKFKTSTKQTCKKCNQIAKSVSQLHEHMRRTHERSIGTGGVIESAQFQSTRNNSLAENLMIEDMTISSYDSIDTHEIALEESTNEEQKKPEPKNYECEVWYKDNSPCDFKSPAASEMLTHTENEHGIKEAQENREDKSEDKVNMIDGEKADVVEDTIHTENEHGIKDKQENREDKSEDKVDIMEGENASVIEDNEVLQNTFQKVVNDNECDICSTKFLSLSELKSHTDEVHKNHTWEYLCTKCTYMSKTEIGMRRHENLFCDICEICIDGNVDMDIHMGFHKTCQSKNCIFTATESHELRDHVVSTHGRNTCFLCRKECSDEAALRYHQESHVKNYIKESIKCGNCNYELRTEDELKEHMKTTHTQLKEDLKCNICYYVFTTQKEMMMHMDTNHKELKIHISTDDQMTFRCDECDYKSRLNIQLKKHKERKHINTMKYKCSGCYYSSDHLAEMWKHSLDEHPNEKVQLNSKVKDDILVNLLAAQNECIREDIDYFKCGVRDSFNFLSQEIDSSFKNMKEVFIEKFDVFKEDVLKNVKKELEENKAATKDQKENCISNGRIRKNAENVFPSQKRKEEKEPRHKVTWVGTSLSKALDKTKFENDLNVDLTVERANCIKEEGYCKTKSFTKIVPEIVEKGGIDTLVLQTGSIEITNIDVNEALVDVTKDIKEYRKEWYQKVEEDSKNLFELAAEATARDSKLNVIIVKRLPRFDRASKDILGIKSQLSKFANHVYDQLWLKQGSPDRIKIVDLELECGKYRHLKNIIFGATNNTK